MKNKFNHLETVLIVLLVFSFATLALTSCDPGTQAPKNAAVVPTASRAAGTIPEGATVELSTLTPGATIYYSTNGADPVKRGVKYSKPINISQTTTIKAVAVKSGMATSDVFSAVYTPDVSLQKVVWLNNLENQESFPQAFDYTGGGLSFTGNYRPDQSWDCYGWGDDGKLYFGYTSYTGQTRHLNDVAVNNNAVPGPATSRSGSSQEDFLMFSYDPATGITRYLDSFMSASRRAGNLREHDGSDPTLPHSEETPKGHTRIHNIGDGYLYLASQPFHDWKQGVDRSDDAFPFPLEDFRGGKFYRLDPSTGLLTDMSATMKGTPAADPGVVIQHEGLITLEWMPSLGYFVALTHPNNYIVFIDPVNNELVRTVDSVAAGFGHKLQTPGDNNSAHITISREMIIDNDTKKIYFYRSREQNDSTLRPIWVYDWESNTLEPTNQEVFGGMWGGEATNPTTKKTYVTHNGGQITELDLATGTATQKNLTVPQGSTIYFLTPSEDWTKLYFAPNLASAANNGLWEYTIATDTARLLYSAGTTNADRNVVTGGKDMLRDGKYYHMSFGSATSSGSWNSGSSNLDTNAQQARIFIYNVDKIYAEETP